MKTFTKLVLITFSLLLMAGGSAFSQTNRDWWNGLSPEWKEFFEGKFMKQSQRDAKVEMSDGKLETIVKLKVLDCSGNKDIKDLKPLSQLKDLEILDISNTGISDLSGLRNVPNLKELDCSNSELIEDLSPLKNMKRLEKLNCHNTSVSNLEPIRYLSLLSLNVSLCFIADNSLKALEGMLSLQKLDISQNELIRNLGYMHKLQELSELNCSKSPVENVDSIASLLNLEYLDISSTDVKGIKALIEIKTLLSIDISDTEIKNIDALYASTGLRNIKAIDLKIDDRTYAEKLKESIKTFNQKRPDCIIDFSVK